MKEQKIQFPTWRYHAQKEARIFHGQNELDEAGDGWVDSPDKLKKEDLQEDFGTADLDEPEDKYLSLDDLTVPELKKLLIEDFGVDKDEFKGKKKADLIEMVKELKEK
jgi:hypothetical protein